MQTILSILLILLLLAALAAWLASRRGRVSAGIPLAARVVYSDTGGWEQIDKPLYSRRYMLTGKPDYIVKDDGRLIPIEVKPNRTAPAPLPSDTLQLAAYGLLIEEEYGEHPPYGLLKYRDAVFRVDFGDELRGELLAVLEEMQAGLDAAGAARSHDDPARCRACGYRAQCDQAIESGPER